PIRVLCLFLLLGICLSGCQFTPPEDDHFGTVADFQFTERGGKQVGRDDLKGKVWVAAFIFTRCAGPCTQICGALARLQHELQAEPDLRLVCFSVDPEHDTPEVLVKHAAKYRADPERWLFLTGEQEKIYTLSQKSFMLGVKQNEGSARTPGNEVMHDPRMWLVD